MRPLTSATGSKFALPLTSWIVANGVLVLSVLTFSHQLPDLVAIHFNLSGVADNYLSRSNHVVLSILLGCGIPAMIVGVSVAMKYGSPDYLNVPQPDYWRRPENYARACHLLLRSMLWLATGLCLWFVALNYVLVLANTSSPPRLPRFGLSGLVGGLLVFITGWMLALQQNFRVKILPTNPPGQQVRP